VCNIFILSLVVLAGVTSPSAGQPTDKPAQDVVKPTTVLTYEEYRANAAKDVQQKNFPKAISELTQAIGLDPKNPTGYFDRGKAYYSKEDFEKAAKDFFSAAALDPVNHEYRLNLALSLNAKGDYTKALSAFNELIQANPNNAAAINGRGMVEFNTGDLADALSDFNQARGLDPDSKLYSEHASAVYAKQQEAVVGTIERYKSTYNSALNDLQRDAIEDRRGKEICGLVPFKSVSGWSGRLTRLDTSFMDNVHVQIDFGNGYKVENEEFLCIKCLIQKYGSTWENAVYSNEQSKLLYDIRIHSLKRECGPYFQVRPLVAEFGPAIAGGEVRAPDDLAVLLADGRWAAGRRSPGRCRMPVMLLEPQVNRRHPPVAWGRC
jgi:tetratricopeptide (TPR) repeat protein